MQYDSSIGADHRNSGDQLSPSEFLDMLEMVLLDSVLDKVHGDSAEETKQTFNFSPVVYERIGGDYGVMTLLDYMNHSLQVIVSMLKYLGGKKIENVDDIEIITGCVVKGEDMTLTLGFQWDKQ